MNECVVVRVGIRLVREICLGEVFLSLHSADCIIASSNTIQDGEAKKLSLIGLEGINVAIRLKSLSSSSLSSSHKTSAPSSLRGDGMNPVYSGSSPRSVPAPSFNRKGSERGGGRGGAIGEVGVDEDCVGILWE